MVDNATQTEEFLIFLQHEEKLTKVYQRVKSIQAENEELNFMNHELITRVQELERYLIKREEQTNKKQSLKNESLLNDVKKLDAELVEQTKSTSGNKTKQKAIQNKKEIKENLKPKDQQNWVPEQNREATCLIKTTYSKNCKEQMNQNPNKLNTNLKTIGIEEKQELIEKVGILEKKLEKEEKERKLVELESRRVRKLNEEFSVKCKRLERLVESKEEFFEGLKHSLKQNQQNNSHHTVCSYFLTESEKADQFE